MRVETRGRIISPEVEVRIVDQAKELVGTMSMANLARHFNVGEDWLRRRVVSGYSSQRSQKARARLGYVAPARCLPPPDTRDLTARFCGDPLPGRSALDQRGSDG
jgi:acyl-CoA synthetase (AMP-forming)/AMP-acid ligase II